MNSSLDLINAYIAHGWSLCPVPGGTKGPTRSGWNTRAAALKSTDGLPPGYGVGLMHAYSGTMALDIDDWFGTTLYGIDLDALYAAPDAVTILSGKPGHGKLLYRMPDGLVLPMKRFETRRPGGPTKGHTVPHLLFELRCGTTNDTTVQDVLPPSIHPDTKAPYQWGGSGHWSRLPLVPQSILDIWQAALVDVRAPSVDGVDASWDEIRAALAHINPDCSREDWITCGMALHWAGEQTFNPAEAFAVWDTWSQGAPHRYPGAHAISRQWASFKTTKGQLITLGSLYHLAREAGWVRPVPDASTLFSAVAPSTPVDIMSLLKPAPPPVDLDLWPDVLARRAREVSEGVGCDPLVPLWAGLGAVCGAIDARTRLELDHGWKVPPVLWLMTIGNPADKKTPGSKPMIDPLATIAAEDRKRFAQDMQVWTLNEARWSKAQKARLDFVGSDQDQLGVEAPAVPEAPIKPVPLRFTVGDITSQQLMYESSSRPRGLLCNLDEMSAWVAKIVNPKSGEDRASWVVAYESNPYEMDRVSTKQTHVENLAVSICGNIQPRVFHAHLDDLSKDGLLQRFIPAVLRGDQTRLGHPVPEHLTSAGEWDTTLRFIAAMPATTYRLSPEAHAAFRAFQVWYEGQKVNERILRSSATYMTAFGKIEGLVGRLALVFHVIELQFAGEVSANVMERVIQLVRGYIIPVYRYLYDDNDESPSTFDQWVTEHIIQFADLERIEMVDIKRSARRPFERAGIKNTTEQSQWVLNAMAMLEGRGWVRRIDDGSKELRGVAEWLINPMIKTMFDDYRKAVIRAKRARSSECTSVGDARLQRVHGQEEIE